MKHRAFLLASLFCSLVLMACESPVESIEPAEQSLRTSLAAADCYGWHVSGGIQLDIPSGHATSGSPAAKVKFGASTPVSIPNQLDLCMVTIEEIEVATGNVVRTFYSGSLDPLWTGGLNFELSTTLYKSGATGPLTELSTYQVRVTDMSGGRYYSGSYGFIWTVEV